MSKGIYLAAQSFATVLILMGMSKLAEIVSIFTKEGKQNLPVAIIQNGTRKNEKCGIGTIATIEKIVEEKELSSPAIIIIGEVVDKRVALEVAASHTNTIASQL